MTVFLHDMVDQGFLRESVDERKHVREEHDHPHKESSQEDEDVEWERRCLPDSLRRCASSADVERHSNLHGPSTTS
jgi:hypothetical protein